jgi:hypothetical protein
VFESPGRADEAPIALRPAPTLVNAHGHPLEIYGSEVGCSSRPGRAAEIPARAGGSVCGLVDPF